MKPVFLGIYVILCFLVAIEGRNRSLGFWPTFFLSLLISPLIMGFALLLFRKKA